MNAAEPVDLQVLVDDFAAMSRAAFPDFDFLAHRGQLNAYADGRPVRRIRVTVPRTVHFHLHSVEVIVDGGPIPPAGITWRTSSTFTEFVAPADPNALFDPSGQHRMAFQTSRENGPWLEISLPEAVAVERIVLHNGANGLFGRAAGVQISVRDDGDWRMIYDGRERVESFRRLCRFGLDSYPRADDLTRQLTDVLVELTLGNVRTAREGIAPLDQSQRAEFRDAVSRSILAPRQLEWTSHGLKRSFRYWTVDEKQRYLEFSRQVIRDLAELTENVCFGFGAALAIVRQGDMTPHDDDLDIIVGLEADQASTLAEGLDLVARTLRSRGHDVGGNFLAHQHVRHPRGMTVDVFVGIFQGDSIDWFPGPRGVLTRSMMFPASVGSMLGQECLLPRSPLLYLERVYGPTWRVPDNSFHHAWRREAYQDIAGVRDGRAGASGRSA